MENIFIGLCILLSVFFIYKVMAVFFLLFREKVDNMSEASIVYDHIEEELPKKMIKQKKFTTNVKRKYKKKGNEQGPMA